MLRVYRHHELQPASVTVDPSNTFVQDVLWVDLVNPDKAEREFVSQHYRINLSQEAEKRTLNYSTWHDADEDSYYIGLPDLFSARATVIQPSGIVFVLTPQLLCTLRTFDDDIAQDVVALWSLTPESSRTAENLLITILEYLTCRFSEVVMELSHALGHLSSKVFVEPPNVAQTWRKGPNLRQVMRELGQSGSMVVRLNSGLRWLERVPIFLMTEASARFNKTQSLRLEAIRHDTQSLIETVGFIEQHNELLLDASLGIINLEENFTMRWLSVIATIFLPPTLIASIYGMNFAEVSHLGGSAAFPLALAIIILSAIGPTLFFLWRGWL